MHFFVVVFVLVVFLMATPARYGSSQARGQTGATAAGLHHSHSYWNRASSATYNTAHSNARSLTQRARPGIEPRMLMDTSQAHYS